MDKVIYSNMLNNQLRNQFSPSDQFSIGAMVTFLAGLERELLNKNQMIIAQIQGCFNFKDANTVEELIQSLKIFIKKNSHLSRIEEGFSYLERLDNQSLFISIRDLCCKTILTDSSLENFKYYLEESYSISITGTTSQSLCMLAQELLSKTSFKTLYDPTIGTGILVYEVMQGHENIEIFGQEMNRESLSFCRMLFVLSGRSQDLENLKQGNVLIDPQHVEGHKVQTFDCVVCHPPFGIKDWAGERISDDPRFYRGIPPRTMGDFAFITQVVESLNEQGKALMILPSGVLFRAGREGEIRKQLIEENLIETIISLPRNMLSDTMIPVNIVIFNKNKETDGIFFIDASSFVDRQRSLNILTKESIQKIATIYHNHEECEAISKLTSLSQVQENQYNLLIERYLTTPLVIETFNRNELKQEQQELQKQLLKTQSQLEEILG